MKYWALKNSSWYRICTSASLALIFLAFNRVSLADEAVIDAIPEVNMETEAADADIMSMDVAGSMTDAINKKDLFVFGGDIRGAYAWSDADQRDGNSERDDEITARIRLEGKWNALETLRLTSRAAFICSTKSCDPQTTLESAIVDNSIEAGKLTLDEFFLQWFRTDKFSLAAGRLQTKFVTRGGVFAKSLDRNNSANTSINWTDGLHGTINPGLGKGWVANLIAEYNDKDGTGSVRRGPLDFSSSDSRISHFIALENSLPGNYIVQRGIDISFLPDSLLKDGDVTGRREDYWGFVARGAARLPLRAGDRALHVAGEIGYAPETPTRQAVGTGISGDTNGLAWNASVSLMDIAPGQSLGVLYGRTESGWLLSPQYANNEKQIEIRWSWRPRSNLIVDARVRQREDLDQILTAQQKSKEHDFFLRATWRYSLID
jgi:hypothetical protein